MLMMWVFQRSVKDRHAYRNTQYIRSNVKKSNVKMLNTAAEIQQNIGINDSHTFKNSCW